MLCQYYNYKILTTHIFSIHSSYQMQIMVQVMKLCKFYLTIWHMNFLRIIYFSRNILELCLYYLYVFDIMHLVVLINE